MNRALQFVNLAGVVILSAICAAQWTINRNVNLQANRLEKVRLDQQQRIAEQEKSINGCIADLDAFRAEIQTLSKSRNETHATNNLLESKLAQAEADREQLRENVAKWTEAVSIRDAELAKARDQIQKLADDRNSAVTRFNELAEKYNTVVQDLNKRAEDYNQLVEKYNQLAKSTSK